MVVENGQIVLHPANSALNNGQTERFCPDGQSKLFGRKTLTELSALSRSGRVETVEAEAISAMQFPNLNFSRIKTFENACSFFEG